jgi:hypothetical protein
VRNVETCWIIPLHTKNGPGGPVRQVLDKDERHKSRDEDQVGLHKENCFVQVLAFFIFLGGLVCVGHSFASDAHFVFLRDVWIRTQRATNSASLLPTNLASHLPTNLATHLPTNLATHLPTNLASHLPTNLATHLPTNLAKHIPTNLATHLPTNLATHLPTNLATHLPANLATHLSQIIIM